MTLDVGAEKKAMNYFHNFFKKASAVRRQIKNYRQSEEDERGLDAPKAKRDGHQREKHGH